MKFVIEEKDGSKVVNFYPDDIEKERIKQANRELSTIVKLIQKDENLKEYFNVPNFRTVTHNPGYLFSYYIKDAAEEILNGIGDVINTSTIFNSIFSMTPGSVHVRYYLDREYGESLKRKSIAGWKNTKFCYAIMIYDRQSFNPGYFIDTDYDFYVPILSESDNKDKRIMQFENYEDAVKVANSLEEESKRFLDEISKLPRNASALEYESVAKLYHNVVRYSSDDGFICFHNSDKIQDDENPWIIRVVQDVVR